MRSESGVKNRRGSLIRGFRLVLMVCRVDEALLNEESLVFYLTIAAKIFLGILLSLISLAIAANVGFAVLCLLGYASTDDV
jgi:hypothetical protein